eukprot:m.199285 g.199285  ORF g.199285 m.199285 type:complete len:887 (+) comp15724_c0_seq4:152-2812(+)
MGNPITAFSKKLRSGVDTFLTNNFENLASSIHKHTWVYVVVPVIVAALCSIGLNEIYVEVDIDDLYTPQGTDYFTVRSYFQDNYEPARFAYIYSIGPKNGDNIATMDAMLDTFDIYEKSVASEGELDGVTYNLTGVCTKTGAGACVTSSVLSLWDYNRTKFEEDTDPFATMATKQLLDSYGQPYNISEVVGGYTIEAGRVVSAQCYRTIFTVQADVEDQGSGEVKDDPETKVWEEAMQDTVRFSTYDNIQAYVSTIQIDNEESENAVDADLNLIFIGIILLVLYSGFVLSRGNAVMSHGSLVIFSVISIGLAIVCAFGLAIAFGVKYSLVISALIFLLFGLGMDDTFVLVYAFTEPGMRAKKPEDRIKDALARAGASITVTSMTDIVAFLAGSNSDIPAITTFCYYAALGVLFDFLMQVTFFCAFMVYSARREKANRYDCACCITASNDEVDHDCSGRKFDPETPGPTAKALKGWYADWLLNPNTKLWVLLFTAGLLGYSAWAYTELEIRVDPEWLVPGDGYLSEVNDIRDQYFQRENELFFTILKEGPYNSELGQQQLQTVSHRLVSNSDEIVTSSCVNWFPAYYSYVAQTHPDQMQPATEDGALTTIINPDYYYSGLVEYLGTTEGAGFSSFFAVAPTNTSIAAGCFITCAFDGGTDFDVQRRIDQMDLARDIAADGELFDGKSYSYRYMFFDGLKVVEEQLLVNIGYAIMGVFLVCLVLLGGVYPSALVVLMIICIDLEVFGALYYWGVTINYVTAINLVVAVGLSVDACAHICHCFMRAKGTKNERVRHALEEIGPAVFNGLISTMIVLLPLAGASSYIFIIFVKSFFNIILHSMFHGLVVFPVILSLIGPDPFQDDDEEQKKPETTQNGARKGRAPYETDV